MDSLRKERPMSFDDNGVNYSPGGTDWRSKYNEVLDMLSETKAELDEFHAASKELEAELEAELARTERAQQDLKVKVSRAETERDDWKSKFMSLQTTHNTTTTSLQRELDKLRQEYQVVKIQLRELEMGNDDLERNERAISSSLSDMEAKYSRVLEEKILLEQELLDKVHLEEETQRLKDELRDTNEENSILKDRIAATEQEYKNSVRTQQLRMTPRSEENLHKKAPADLDLSDLSPSKLPPSQVTPRASGLSKSTAQIAAQRTPLFNKESPLSTIRTAGLGRSSSTNYSLYSANSPTTASSSRLPTRGTPMRSSVTSSSLASTTSTTTSKSKGVQMVTEMRARVRNLEQKIHTKVPRLRIASRSSVSSNTSSATSGFDTSSVSTVSTAKTSWESQRPSMDFDKPGSRVERDAGGDSGWVLIMEDSPSPQKDKKENRRLSNPLAPTSFRTNRAKSPSLSTGPHPSLGKSMNGGPRRPASRQSGSLSVTTTTRPRPSPNSRPTTPTFLPLPTNGMYTSASALKRSTGPSGPNPYNHKRASFGTSTSGLPSELRDRSTTLPPLPRPNFDSEGNKALPRLPLSHTNITVRPKASGSTDLSSILSKSRIGRPPSSAGRRSSGDAQGFLDINDLRPRAESSAARAGR
ncbi:hypothetical protein FA15DRAFT_662529 [Coprinopsis marcescibilis]|uniref:NUDE domain-containing protein n=1 Tax=Coprinopsis marcescibilis TaxID=230819 RepID=A0A5C3LDK8_COPMA|nr:hypothetical protein FA15DRAFT_662529 [Coprinopsis marcescibilis]